MIRQNSQIIAMGGGGFSMEPENPALDRYVLAQAQRRNPAICFLATASGDADTYIAKFYAAFTKHRCRPTHVALFDRTPNLKDVLLAQDIIYVGGGNTKSMLAALALDDGVAAHFVGRRLFRIVSSRPNAQGYAVHYNGSKSIEMRLPVTRLRKAAV